MKCISLVFAILSMAGLALGNDADYFPAVAKLIEDRCLDCHSADDPEGKFVMETHADLLKGGESGPAFEAGKSGESLLVKYLRGEVMKDGKRKFMPPGKKEKLSKEEIEAFAKWIDAGAKPPEREMGRKVVVVPKVEPKVRPRLSVTALAYSPTARLLAAGRYGVVEIIDPLSQTVVKRLEGHAGNVNGVVWSANGTDLFAASGENSVTGEVTHWSMPEGKRLRTIRAHRDTLYSIAISPDGQLLATGSYDQKIKLWKIADGSEARTLSGHNGAIFGLAFRPDGRFLASASADRTVKLWDVATGERRDTLSQPLKEQVTVAWSPDGKRLAAAGADNRIRVWKVSADARETTNPLMRAHYAHEQPILRLAWSPDGASILSSAQDGTLRVWESATFVERVTLPKQPEWPISLAFAGDLLVTGCGDGSIVYFDSKSGQPVAPRKAGATRSPCDEDAAFMVIFARQPDGCELVEFESVACQSPPAAPAAKTPPKPVISRISPRGIQRGRQVELAIEGKDLASLASVRCTDPRVEVFTGTPSSNRVPIIVRTPTDLPRANYEFVALGADAKELGRVPLMVSNLPVHDFTEKNAMAAIKLPATVWGKLSVAGEGDRYEFEAKAGQTIVLDATSKGVGGKADLVLQLTDTKGAILASSNNFHGEDAPFIAHRIDADGKYVAVVKDLQMTGGPDHVYTLTAGVLPYVVTVHPITVTVGTETEVQLIGYNLPGSESTRRIKVKAEKAGPVTVPLDGERFFSRLRSQLVAIDGPNQVEIGGNHSIEKAQALPLPASVNGRLRTPQQADFFRFAARKGVTYAIETEAARRGSPADTKITVLTAEGRSVERMLFAAIRDSAVTFRAVDSINPDVRVENWREMELNQLMWTGGEINKIFRMPEGPDSGFQYYASGGKRIAFFNTTATAHALDESCYIVEPHPPGSTLAVNGLPAFVLNYENDDDGDRELGTDSRVLFTAPQDGDYLVRLDESRGFGGEAFTYRLIVREARPDFSVAVAEYDGNANAGSGVPFALTADRIDGFDGDIRCEISGVPPGWHGTTPLLIEAGHLRARGCLSALPGAKEPTAEEWKSVKVVARATINGATVERAVAPLGRPKLQGAPQLYIGLVPPAAGKHEPASEWREFDSSKPFEFTIAPGEIIPAWLVIKRAGANGALRFEVENLPHGVIVDNLGLNGITLLEAQEKGEIFIKAAPWVKEQDRLAFAVSRDAGKQASLPIMLRVRDKAEKSEIVNVK